jgi:O-antigen/teichoic acid export membrane protein
LALFALVGYLSTLSFPNTAANTHLTQCYARKDMDEYAACQHSAMAVFLILALSGTALLAVGAWFLPIGSWLGLHHISRQEGFWVTVLLGAQVLWACPAGQFIMVFQTIGDLAKSTWIGNLQRIASAVLIAACLWLGGGLISVALIQLLPLFATTALIWIYLSRRRPELLPGVSKVSLRKIQELLPPSLFQLICLLAIVISQQGPVLLISSFLGGVAVALFVTSRTLANLVRQLTAAFYYGLWPDLISMDTRKQYQKLRFLYRVQVMGTTALSIAIAAALWYEGGDVISVWTRGRLRPDLPLLRLLLLQLILQTPWTASAIFSQVTNRHWNYSRLYLASSVVGLGFAALLARSFGVRGVLVGLILGEAALCYHFVTKDACETIGEPYGPFARRLWAGLTAVGAIALGVGWVAHQIAWGPKLLRWAEVGGLTSLAALLSSWWLCLDGTVRAEIVERVWPASRPAHLKAVLLGRQT